MKRMIIPLLLIFSFLFVNIIQVDFIGVEAKGSDSKGNVYFFGPAFIWGNYEKMEKYIDYFHCYNSNITNYTINVLGYEHGNHRWVRVIADDVKGGPRIGYILRHQCCMFAFGFLGITVSGVNASSF